MNRITIAWLCATGIAACAPDDSVRPHTVKFSTLASAEPGDEASADVVGCQLLGCDDGLWCTVDTCTTQGCTHVDTSDDGNVCTYDDPTTCEKLPYIAGTSCGGNRRCNGAGDCAGPCVFPSDCPAVAPGGCEVRSCLDGVCHQEDKDEYTPCGPVNSGGLCMGGECSQPADESAEEKATAESAEDADRWIKPCLFYGCDDGDDCTVDHCTVVGCQWFWAEVGEPCPGGTCADGGECVQEMAQEKPGHAGSDLEATSLTCLVLAPESECTKDGRTGKCTESGECCTGCVAEDDTCEVGYSASACGGGGKQCASCNDNNSETLDSCLTYVCKNVPMCEFTGGCD